MDSDYKNVRVLIAEDDAGTRASLAEQIRLLGYHVVAEASNGNEAVELAFHHQPDLAILDIRMPERDGLEAAAAIMQQEPIAIVMLTGFHDESLIRRANDVGVFAYLVKPASMETLRATMEVALVRFGELQEARKEARDLKDALETRKMVERAKGVLMERLGLSEADAFRRLQKESNNQSKPLKQIAAAILIAEGLFKPDDGEQEE